MDDGRRILKEQYRLLAVFLLLDGSQSKEYQRALLTSISLWEWMKRQAHPMWDVFKNNASVFNEESGEVAFSVLARDIASSGVRSDCEAVSRKFRIIKPKMVVAKGLEIDLCGDDFSSASHCTVDVKSPDVVAATAFFKKMIRQLQRKSHHHFGATCGFLDKKARGKNAARQLVAAEVIPPIKWKNALTRLSIVAVQMKAVMNRYWVYQHRDIWPAAQPEIAVSLGEDSDGSAEEVMGGDDAKAAPVRRVGRKGKRARSPSVHSSGSSELEGDDGVLFIGRIVSCPAWFCGRGWATERYGSKKAGTKARLHGKLEECKDFDNEYICRWFHDHDYCTRLTAAQVRKTLVPVEDEEKVEDTPFVNSP